jgi:hypothetical protein
MAETKLPFADWQTPEQRESTARLWRKQDAARRFQCNLMQFWRMCTKPVCRRNRTCSSEPDICFERNWALVPEDEKEWVRGATTVKELVRTADQCGLFQTHGEVRGDARFVQGGTGAI